MKPQHIVYTGLALAALFAAGTVIAQDLGSGEMWGRTTNNQRFTKRVWIESTLEVDGATRFDGGVTQGGDITLQNGETISNATDNVVGVTFGGATAALGTLRVISDSASPADNDTLSLIEGYADDDGGTSTKFIGITLDTDDVTTNSEDATVNVGVVTAGTFANELELTGAALYPTTDEGLDLGSSSKEFKDLYIDGTANVDTLVATTADVNGGTVDGATIGASSESTGKFTTLQSTGLATLASASIAGSAALTSATITTADINGGAVDGVTIGGASAGAGTFSSLVATTADINAGTFDGTVGGTTPGTGAFTTLAASGTIDANGAIDADGTFNLGAGTTIDKIFVGSADIPNGGTSVAATITGVLPGDYAVVSAAEAITSATVVWAVPTTNTLTISCPSDPGTTVTVNYMVMSGG